MKKSWGLIPKIVSGQKTIESRWYQTRRTPWDKIQSGDIVYFKNSGESVTAQAIVSRVLQYALENIDDARKIVTKFGKAIQMVNPSPETWGPLPRYCILIFLENPRPIHPFNINKLGFGSAAAWLTLPNINTIKKSPR